MTTPFLPPVERPKGLRMKLVYALCRRLFGKVPTPIAVMSARTPFAFLSFNTKIARLDRKLRLPKETQFVVRQQVSSINGCEFCLDLQRAFAAKRMPGALERFDALPQYQTSPLFSDAERAALDYATELTSRKHVAPDTFAALRKHYSEREICEVAWLVATEHVYNIANHGLNIGSDGLCRIPSGNARPPAEERAESRTPMLAER